MWLMSFAFCLIGCQPNAGPPGLADAALADAAFDSQSFERRELDEAIDREKRNDLRGARTLLNVVVLGHPGTPEAAEAKRILERIRPAIEKLESDEIAKLEKLVPEKQFKDLDGNIATFHDAATVKTWLHDYFGSGQISARADKGTHFFTVSFELSSKSKAPNLSCVLAYARKPKDALLTKLPSECSIEFRRWDSLSSMLGTNPDNGNDFAKADSVKFTTGKQIEDEMLKAQFVYLLMARQPSLTRNEVHQNNGPDVAYGGTCPNARQTLDLSSLERDFVVAAIHRPGRALDE